MVAQVTNRFTQYELSDEELAIALQVNPLTKMHVQNRLAEEAHKRINVEWDTLDPTKFLQQEAYLKGRIEMMEQIIEDFNYEVPTPAETKE